MKIKHQVFVSSTYEDLKEEREQVIKAVLEMGHIPVGMEMFSAGDEQQWELIKRQIDDCDYYMVVIAHRYGSVDGNISYTEKEYDYALSKGVPTLGFLLHDDAKWPKSKIDTDPPAQNALIQFKEKVKKKIVNFWSNADDLHAKVSVSLAKAITAYPRPGWVRATEGVGPEVMTELSRLSKENANLRSLISKATEQQKLDEAEDKQKIIALLTSNNVKVSFYFADAKTWSEGITVTLYRIFRLLAPQLMVEVSVETAAAFLAKMLKPKKDEKRELRSSWQIPSNNMKEWLADFQALELISPSTKKHHIKDTKEYWCITEKGKAIYTLIRIGVLEKRLERTDEQKEHP